MRTLAVISVLLAATCAAPPASAAYADPPGRVAYLADAQGDVGYSPGGEDQWVGVVRNRPLVPGDRLWSGRNSRAELQIGGSAVRLGSDTSFQILDLDDRIAQFELTQGTLNLHVRALYRGQSYEVATPMLAFSIREPGRYRIDVGAQDAQTTLVVWEGAAEAYGERNRFPLNAGDAVRFYDPDLRDYEMLGIPRPDAFDRWCAQRDQRMERSASLRYLGADVAGYAELDQYGSWQSDRRYGNVWYPEQVRADWAPYREGHWVWQEPWGWTWVDDAPWGFAPSHYGRWAHVNNRWGWIPGPRNTRSIYAPALVAFFGGSGWNASLSYGNTSPVGWFPLGPREVYVPSYRASRDYFDRVNVTNTTINITTVNNVYNNYARGGAQVSQVTYANRAIPGAVTVVPGDVFANARPVRQSAMRMDRSAFADAQVSRVAPIAPSARSVMGSGAASRNRPSAAALDRPVVARHSPPATRQAFAARQPQLQRTPGQVPEPRAAEASTGRNGKARGNVRVIAAQQDALDARAAGSQRRGTEPGSRAAPPAIDRPAPIEKPAPAPQVDRGTNPRRDPRQAPTAPAEGPAMTGREAQEAAQQRRDAAAREQRNARQLAQQQAQDAVQREAVPAPAAPPVRNPGRPQQAPAPQSPADANRPAEAQRQASGRNGNPRAQAPQPLDPQVPQPAQRPTPPADASVDAAQDGARKGSRKQRELDPEDADHPDADNPDEEAAKERGRFAPRKNPE